MATTTATTAVERSGPAIRAALQQHAAADSERFAVELRQALARAADNLDVAGVEAVLTRWHAVATMAANPLSVEERALLQRARGGDFAGLRARDEHGGWQTL